jgi:hypothetical protein
MHRQCTGVSGSFITKCSEGKGGIAPILRTQSVIAVARASLIAHSRVLPQLVLLRCVGAVLGAAWGTHMLMPCCVFRPHVSGV